jgi:hypothetical protein
LHLPSLRLKAKNMRYMVTFPAKILIPSNSFSPVIRLDANYFLLFLNIAGTIIGCENPTKHMDTEDYSVISAPPEYLIRIKATGFKPVKKGRNISSSRNVARCT